MPVALFEHARLKSSRTGFRGAVLLAALLSLTVFHDSFGQVGPSDIRVFGYFQPQYIHQNGPESDGVYNSFSLQQLNVFFQKDLAKGITSFVNVEAVNSFSTRDGWGSMRIEEAWVRFRKSKSLNLKAGLSIPIFNNFNEIKNRMPLIPYVIRPLVYESSLSNQLNNPLYVPQQAFLQGYGWWSAGKGWKIDYAAYLGNTDMVVSDQVFAEDDRDVSLATGIDSSSAFLVGWRVGARKGSLKFGFSGTVDKTNLFSGLGRLPINLPPDLEYGEAPRYRGGFDLSFRIGKFWVENENIGVRSQAEDSLTAEVNFGYTTLGWDFSDRLRTYVGYQIVGQRVEVYSFKEGTDIHLGTIGGAYILEETITLKLQYAYAYVDVFDNPASEPDPRFHYITAAVAVLF